MSCCNSRNEYDKQDCCCNKEHDSYKKIECFECECKKKRLCDIKRPMGYDTEKVLEDYE